MKSETLKFGDIAHLRKDTINPKKIDQSIYLGLEHINKDSLSLNSTGSSNSLESNKFIFSAGDILFGKLRPYFRKVYKPDFDGICSTDIWVIQPKDEDICRDFLFYVMADQRFINFANQGATGTRMPRANWDHVANYQVNKISFNEQRQISEILRSLDDKIKLNQKINETLEEIAKTLFKSWFIDFDPVRAKAEGRPTGLSKEISDLFPDSFEVSELGEIPKGWKESKIKDFCISIQKGISPKYTENQSYPVINQKCIRNLEINFDLCKFTEYKKIIEGRYLENFDILLNSMGVGTLGRSALFIEHKTKAVVDGCISVIRGKDKVHGLYVYQSISRREDEIINLSQGSTGQTTLKTEDIGNLKLVKPNNQVIELFYKLVADLYKKKYTNSQEIKVLTNLRDTLLPKLISGELKIPDAENLVEEAGI